MPQFSPTGLNLALKDISSALGQQSRQRLQQQQLLQAALTKTLFEQQLKAALQQQSFRQQMELFQSLVGGGIPPVPSQVQPTTRAGREVIDTTAVGSTAPITKPVQRRMQFEPTLSLGPAGTTISLKPKLTEEAEIQKAVKKERTLRAVKGLPGESAGKLTLIQQAEKDLDRVEQMLFTPEGRFLRGLAFRGNVPFSRAPLIGAFIPETIGGRGGIINSSIENALEAKLRIETGAAATQDEFNRIFKRFSIGPLTTAQEARNKINRLREFMRNARITIDPSGNFKFNTGDRAFDRELNEDVADVGKLPVNNELDNQVNKMIDELERLGAE